MRRVKRVLHHVRPANAEATAAIPPRITSTATAAAFVTFLLSVVKFCYTSSLMIAIRILLDGFGLFVSSQLTAITLPPSLARDAPSSDGAEGASAQS